MKSMNEHGSRSNRRLDREKKTIRAMIAIYCRGNHRVSTVYKRLLPNAREHLCAECEALLEYALARLDRCPFGGGKPPCAKCTVHCYKPSLRRQVQAVMRYSGPRMLWRHPILALYHGKFGHFLDTVTRFVTFRVNRP